MARVYLKPGDVVQATFVDLVVAQETRNCLGYAISHLGDSELRYFPEELENLRDENGYEIKYAWDLSPQDEHYGKPYYEK